MTTCCMDMLQAMDGTVATIPGSESVAVFLGDLDQGFLKETHMYEWA